MNDQGLPLRVRVSLGAPFAAAREAGADTIRARIEADVAELLRDLGVPRSPSVELESLGEETTEPIRVFVEGRPCRFPAPTIADALAYVEGTPQVAADNDALREGLRRLNAAGAEAVAELAAIVCVTAISDQPEILGAATVDPTVRAALGAGMTVAPKPDKTDDVGSDGADPVERLIAASAADRIDMHVDPAILRDLTTEFAREDLLQFLRDGLFTELGLPLPPFHIRPDSSLRPGGFAFRINGVRSPARIILAHGTVLVNDTADRLQLLNVDAQPTLNPATAQPASIVDARHDSVLKEEGLTTWSPAGFLILCFAAAIRRRAYALMTRDVAARMSQQVGWAFPVLNEAVARHVGTDRLTRVLRELLRDGISIHNLRRIEELILRYDTADTNGSGRDLVGFVRAGLADLIAHTVSRGTRTAVVYLLEQGLERELTHSIESPGGRGVDDPVAERVAAALRAELAYLPPTAANPALLTRDAARPRLAASVRHEFPRTAVLSYSDLPLDWNVQPVARIGTE